MRKLSPAFESGFLFASAGLLLGGAMFAIPLRARAHPGNPRLAFGLAHLPPALLAAAVFTACAALLYRLLRRRRLVLDKQPEVLWLTGLGLLFCAFWMPVLFSSGFVQDDWMLLAAASIRNLIHAHPLASWFALDSVDGNFRPLGTVLYYSYALRLFGLHPTLFLAANFFLNLATTLTAFLIVRRMGYSRAAASAASILFLSRGILYTQSCWTAALGDCIVLFLTSVVVLLLLHAIQSHGTKVVSFHLAAWTLFIISTLAKQSAFATPLIVAAILLIRPGPQPAVALRHRLVQAVAALAAYGAVAEFLLLHARHLLGARDPYPLQVTALTVIRSFAYFFWYLFTLYFPNRVPLAHYLPGMIGLVLLAALLLLVRRVPALLGERPRDLLFLAAAAAASVALFLGLTSRNEAYYGAECALWLSLALGIMLTRLGSPMQNTGARAAWFALCLLVVTGFLDVRLKQVSLFWAGGYVWGDSSTHADLLHWEQIQHALAASPSASTIVIVNSPQIHSWFAAMVLLSDPAAQRILVYNPKGEGWLANNHDGLRPVDSFPALTDVDAYNWLTPISEAKAHALTPPASTLWLNFSEDTVTGSTAPPSTLAFANLPGAALPTIRLLASTNPITSNRLLPFTGFAEYRTR